MRALLIGILISGIVTICFGERYIVIDSKDGRIMKRLPDVDSLVFIDATAEPETDIGCSDSLLALGYYTMHGCGGNPLNEPEWVCWSPSELKYLSRDVLETRTRICPDCLGETTRIAAPSGEINVREIKPGTRVWTLDAEGKKVAAPVLKVTAKPVLEDHKVIHLKLDDGRELLVSPNHPGYDGKDVNDLKMGGQYDGSKVVGISLVPYQGKNTHDILPAGATGLYWANGILIGSTLKEIITVKK